MSVPQEIKNRLDIVDVISETVQLRKSGRTYSGFCPFHANTRTPAFHVFPDTQTWHCFGACSEGGDLFNFVMKQEGLDFKEALVKLADRAGVTLDRPGAGGQKKKAAYQKQADLLAAAADYFHQLFLHAPQAKNARRYVDGRALNPETIAAYKIGFALHSWDACRMHFNGQGYSDQELVAVGLLTENPDKGTRYDRFRNRLLIPIRDLDGRVVGFGARALERDGIPKYLNSPQTNLFDKSSLLYGLDMAKRHIREARQVVIVEGYMDVMQAWQAGFRNVVAQMGTALTERQLTQLKRYTKRFVLALDADVAGVKATMRGLQVARETLDRTDEVKFDARGLVRHEGRLQADIRIVTLPDGNDPDKIIREDAAAWPKLLAQAKPVVAYVIGVMTADLDPQDAKAKTAVAQQVIPLIKDIEDPVERDHYWQELARVLGVDERALRQVRLPQKRPSARRQPSARQRPLSQPSASPGQSRPPMPPPPPDFPTNGDEMGGRPAGRRPRGHIRSNLRQANYLRQCLAFPRALAQVNHKLKQHGQTAVSEADFDQTEDKILLRQIQEKMAAGSVVTFEELCDSLDDILLSRVQSLLTLSPTPESERDRLADSLVLSVLNWRKEKTVKHVTQQNKLLKEARTSGDLEAVTFYQQQLREMSRHLLEIDRARDARSAVSRRRAEEA